MHTNTRSYITYESEFITRLDTNTAGLNRDNPSPNHITELNSLSIDSTELSQTLLVTS